MGDSDGLFLRVTPAGGKLWQLEFRTAGKEKLRSIGAWPAVSLSAADHPGHAPVNLRAACALPGDRWTLSAFGDYHVPGDPVT